MKLVSYKTLSRRQKVRRGLKIGGGLLGGLLAAGALAGLSMKYGKKSDTLKAKKAINFEQVAPLKSEDYRYLLESGIISVNDIAALSN